LILTALIVFFLSVGTFFMFVAALGIYRMPDVYNQLHTSTKAITLGLANLMVGTVLSMGTVSVGMKAVLIIAFQFITAPVAAHMISRVQHPHAWEGTVMDEITGEPTAGTGEEAPGASVSDRADETG